MQSHARSLATGGMCWESLVHSPSDGVTYDGIVSLLYIYFYPFVISFIKVSFGRIYHSPSRCERVGHVPSTETGKAKQNGEKPSQRHEAGLGSLPLVVLQS